MKQPNKGRPGSIERACAGEAVLPHPSPLPLGEGANSAAVVGNSTPRLSGSSAAFPKPNGLETSSPGLRGTSYPGFGTRRAATPTGLRHGWGVCRGGPQPRWGCEFPGGIPRVARSSQPWAGGRNPVGIQRWTLARLSFGAWICAAWLGLTWLAVQSVAQEKIPPPTAAVSSIKGVKEEAAAKVKPIEPTVPPPPKNTAQGVNKIDGIDTINGVKADGRAPVLPPPPVQPPPPPPPPKAPPVVGVKGTAVNVGGGTVGAGGSIRAVNGVAGINAAKLQNLEVALQIKQNPTPEGPGKAKAAAALLGPGPGTKTGPKKDGRDVFQEFEKLPNKGS